MNFINYIKIHKKPFGISFFLVLILLALFLFFISFERLNSIRKPESVKKNSQDTYLINQEPEVSVTNYPEKILPTKSLTETPIIKTPTPTINPQKMETLIETLKKVIFNDTFYSSIYYENDICEYSDKNGNNCIRNDEKGICDYYLCWDGKNGLANTDEEKRNVTEKYKNFTKTIRTGSIERLYLNDSILIYKTPNYFKMSLSELQKMHSQTESGVIPDVPTAFASPVYVDKDQILWSSYRCSTGWAPSDNDPESVKKDFKNCNLISDALDKIFNKKASN